MYVILDQGPAIFVLVLATILLGCYPAAFNYVELAGRKPAHTFLDFTAAFALSAIPCAISLSNTGLHSDFIPGLWEQLSQDNSFVVGCACIAGLLMMIGTICLQFGMAFTGIAVCVLYQTAVSLSIGIGINYFLDTRLARATWIFPGLMCFSVAAMFGTLAHLARLKALKNRRDKGRVVLEDLLQGKPLSAGVDGAGEGGSSHSNGRGGGGKMRVVTLPLESSSSGDGSPDLERGGGSAGGGTAVAAPPVQQRKPAAGGGGGSSQMASPQRSLNMEGPDALLDLESPSKSARRPGSLRLHGAQVMQDTNTAGWDYSAEPRTPKGHSLPGQSSIRSQYCQRGIELDASKPLLGLAVTCVGGVCFGLMTPLMFIATSALPTTSHWRTLPYGVPPLTAYNAFFLYALTFVFTGAGTHAALLYRPLFDCEQSSLVEYAFDQRGRVPSLAAGLAAGLGMALQFMGSLGGGYAVAELVKLYPLLSMVWGVTLFHEFRAVGRGAVALLSAMCMAYVLGVGLLAGGRNHPLQQ